MHVFATPVFVEHVSGIATATRSLFVTTGPHPGMSFVVATEIEHRPIIHMEIRAEFNRTDETDAALMASEPGGGGVGEGDAVDDSAQRAGTVKVHEGRDQLG